MVIRAGRNEQRVREHSRLTKKSAGESPAAAAATRDPKSLGVLETLTAARSLSSRCCPRGGEILIRQFAREMRATGDDDEAQ